MSDKIITWFANFTLACVLVLITVQSPVYAANEALSVPLSGTAVMQTVGDLQIEPASFDTGLVDIGQSSSQTVQIKHVGAADADPVQINGVTVFGGQSGEFANDFGGYVTLYPGDTVEATVTFTPAVPGAKSLGFRMDIDGASAPHVLIITGKARYPLTSDLESESDELKMGQVVEGVLVTKNLTLTNSAIEADAPLINVMAVDFSGDTPESFNSDFAPVTIGPGEDATFQVQMQSAQVGFKSAILTIQHDGNNKPVEIEVSGEVVEPAAVPVNFTTSGLKNTGTIVRATSLAFGPDNHLYITEMEGLIHEFAVTRNGKDNYVANKIGTINVIKNTQNHNDDGSLNNTKKRLLTGVLVVGTAGQPIIYAQSSDWRQGGGPKGTDTNLDTNSGILHKLTKNGDNWSNLELVRGLPRSEENHHGNGIIMVGNKLLMAMGGTTNMGLPSNNFALMTETALSGAILEFDLGALGNNTYDLPTLDDQSPSGGNDNNDPFGGNNGLNQAKLVAGGPVQIYATGMRNSYDLVLAESGKLYATDNGPNAGWGGAPGGGCVNTLKNDGSTFLDQLHHINKKGYYGGHPNPVRGDKNNTFHTGNPQSPVEIASNPIECQYKQPGNGDGSLTTFPASTNGIDEYTASNFGDAMKGDLLMTGFDKAIYRIILNNAGTAVTSKSKLAANIGNSPLDVIAQGDDEVFPGTVWMVDNTANQVFVLEPADY